MPRLGAQPSSPSFSAHDRDASDSFSDLADDDIEMHTLEDVAMTPRSPRHLEYPAKASDSDDDDEDDDEEDGGRRALLGDAHDPRPRGLERIEPPVSSWKQVKSIALQTAPTLLLTTVSLLFTGELLDRVSHWRAMASIPELIMIVPVILNLKGNLEMNLSSRLGTAANVGDLDSPSSRNEIVFGNLALLQLQAGAVSFVAANVAFLLGHFVPAQPTQQEDPFPELDPANNGTAPANATALLARRVVALLTERAGHIPHLPLPGVPKFGALEYALVAATAMLAASLSSALLGSFMSALVVACRKLGLDPDNIAPPIASCLGDLVTLTLVGVVSSLLFDTMRGPLPLIAALAVAALAAGCGVLAWRNPRTRPLLGQGWAPLLGAMAISSGTGIVLDVFVSRYRGFALLAVVISGLPGSVGAICVARLATALHAGALHARAPVPAHERGPPAPSSRLVMLTLFAVTFPIELGFMATIRALGWVRLPFAFVALSVCFFCIAVMVSLALAHALTRVLWRLGRDPDMYAMPVHSALMDLVGQLLLVACFEIVSSLGKDVKVPEPG